ncbi:MAG: hypothetical protein RLZZ28_2243 [Bacteroidota bacterium]
MQPIKNIVFDLGGIFMNLDYHLTEKAFVDLGIVSFPQMYTQHHANPMFEDFETGKISTQAFYEAFRKSSNSHLSDEQIKTAWNAMLLDFPAERLRWLTEIGKKYQVYLFSNTNQIHYEAFIKIVHATTGINNFNDFFIKAYYSHELGLRKPYVASFKKILEEQKLVAAETVFIDDTLKNIIGAKEAGMQTIHLQAPKTVLDLEL